MRGLEKIHSNKIVVFFLVYEIFGKTSNLVKNRQNWGSHNFSTINPISKQKTPIKSYEKSKKFLLLLFPRKTTMLQENSAQFLFRSSLKWNAYGKLVID